jgi:hypothetical protein
MFPSSPQDLTARCGGNKQQVGLGIEGDSEPRSQNFVVGGIPNLPDKHRR